MILFTNAFDLYSNGTDYDFDNAVLAEAAANAVNAALNDLTPDPTEVGPSSDEDGQLYGIGYDTGPGDIVTFIRGGEAQPSPPWTILEDTFTTPDDRIYASFEVVPEPGTALLMGLGFAGLGIAGRRQRRA